MSTKTRDFAAKARTIVGGTPKPTSLQDFLEDAPKAGNTESRTHGVRKDENTDTAIAAKSTEREEFRFDSELAERLRRCTFETRRKKKKTNIVRDALDRYLREQGF